MDEEDGMNSSQISNNIFLIADTDGHQGKETKKGNVLYIVGEGFSGLKKRATALDRKHGMNIDEIGLDFSRQAADFLSPAKSMEVVDCMMEKEGGYDLVFVDTLSRNFGAGDENKTQDMANFISNIDKFVRNHNQLGGETAVILVHHTGLGNSERGRGSGALYNALDCEFLITKDDDYNVEIKCTKNKEGEVNWTKELKLDITVIGLDEDTGEEITTCIITDPEEKSIKGSSVGMSGRTQDAYDALKEECINNGVESVCDKTGEQVFVVSVNKWKENAKKRMAGVKNFSRDFNVARKELVDEREIVIPYQYATNEEIKEAIQQGKPIKRTSAKRFYVKGE